MRDFAGTVPSYPPEDQQLSRRPAPVLLIADWDLRIVLTPTGNDKDNDEVTSDVLDCRSGRLSPPIDRIVRGLASSNHAETERFAIVPDKYAIAVTPLDGDAGSLLAITIHRLGRGNRLAHAAFRYSLTPRETEVLALILDGAHAPEIADVLCIAESTVQGYFKRLLSKTGARNRPSMVATVLGWSQDTTPFSATR
jgi:DNA-binding CsgD family transcriptional regulator